MVFARAGPITELNLEDGQEEASILMEVGNNSLVFSCCILDVVEVVESTSVGVVEKSLSVESVRTSNETL